MGSMNNALERRDSYRGPDLKIFVKDVRDRQGRKRPITVRSWSTIKDVKDLIQQVLHVPPSAQRLFFGPLMTSGGELPNHRTLHDAGIYRSGETLLLDIKGGTLTSASSDPSSSLSSLRSTSSSDVCISSSMVDSCPKLLRHTVQQARRGMALGLKPELILDGSGGAYFLRDARKAKVGVFKPADEEPYAENNPRGYIKHTDARVSPYDEQPSLRAGIVPGEACLREVAAYLLDHKGFSGVPMTTLAEALHPAFNINGARMKLSEGGASMGPHSLNPKSARSATQKKVGSFQTFVNAECTMDDMSPSKISVDEVHKIAILDIRLMNADRNSANLLCKRKEDDTLELVPIDHGYCLRSVCDVSWMDWCWLDWPQLKQPLSEESMDYILKLDVEADAQMLKDLLNLEPTALDYFYASSKLLQEGVKAGLTLYEIAIICCRNDDAGEMPSKLEMLTSMAVELATNAVENGRWHHAAASRALADQLSPEGGSLLLHERVRASPFRFFKSASSCDLLTFPGSDSFYGEAKNDLPATTQSSVSDSSSDAEDAANDREECEEWAAAVIADVSMDKSMPMRRLKSRSLSTESEHSVDTNLSSSPKGFWRVRPGSSPVEVDSEAFSWSPHLSPMKVLAVPTAVGGEDAFLTPSVAFAESFSDGFILPPLPAVDIHGVNKVSHSGSGLIGLLYPPLKKAGSLGRSQSYSAFSALRSISNGSNSTALSSERSRIPEPIKSDQFRKYFRTFVDLVVTRETTALASHHRRNK